MWRFKEHGEFMKFQLVMASVVMCLFSVASLAEISDGLGKPIKPSTATRPASPAANPMQAPAKAPEGPALFGRVVSSFDGNGFTYLELEEGGKRFWVAGTQVKVKKGDRIKFVENVVMENFTSKLLKRTFDRITFASSVAVVK